MANARLKPHFVVADNLYALGLHAGLTQIVLAERAKMDLRSLQRIEAGEAAGKKKRMHRSNGGKVTSKWVPKRGRPAKPAAKRGRA